MRGKRNALARFNLHVARLKVPHCEPVLGVLPKNISGILSANGYLRKVAKERWKVVSSDHALHIVGTQKKE